MAHRREDTDQRFAHFCRTGDPAALGEVFDRTATELLHVAVWLVGNRADAEDLLQRTFVQAIDARGQFEPGRPVMPWLMGVLANQARLLRRERERRAPARPTAATAATAEDPRDAAAAAELREVVQRVQDELGTPYREVLTLHLEQGLNAKEIAARLGRPAGTVRTQLVRALERLRRRLPGGFVAGFAPFAVDAAALAGVRAEVLAVAQAAVPTAVAVSGATGAAAAVTGGVVAMKKTLLAGAVLAVLVGLVGYAVGWGSPEPAASPTGPEAAPVTASGEVPSPTATAEETPASAQDRVAVQAPGAADPGPALAALEIRLRWADTGEPAVRQGVKVHAGGPRFRAGMTDEAGLCHLPDLMPGTWTVKPAMAWERTEVELRALETATLEAEVVRTGRVRGVVLDEHGRPAPGASLWLSEARGPGSMEETNDYAAGRTDALGRFELFARGSHRIGARCPGHAPSLQRTVSLQPGEIADVELRLRGPGGTVRGRVVGGDGRPVAWAHVLVGRPGAGGSWTTAENWGEPKGFDLHTDRDGRFAAEGVAPGTVEVQAWAEGFGPAVTNGEVEAGAATEVLLALPPGAVLRGCARDDRGQPVAQVWIDCGGATSGGFGGGSTHTAPDGTFRLENLAGGERYLRAIRWPLRHEEQLELTAGQDTVWDPVLSDRYLIAGIVLGPDGGPAENLVYVSCGPESGEGFGAATAHPTVAGRFELPNSHPGPQRVGVTDAYLRPLVEARNVPAGTRDLVLHLPATEGRTATVRGRVVDPAGNPVAAEVRVRSLAPRIGQFTITVVSTDGSWQTMRLAPGRYQLEVIQKGTGGIHALPAFDLGAEESRDQGDVVVHRPGSATFRVFDTDGAPVGADPLCTVFVRGADGRELGQGAVAGGVAAVLPLPPGHWLVTADARTGIALGTVDVTSDGNAEVTLHLKTRTTCRIEFDCGDLPAPQYALLEVRAPGGPVLARFRGHFRGLMPRMELYGQCTLPPGRYQIECTAEGGLRGQAEVTAAATGGRVDLTMPLSR